MCGIAGIFSLNGSGCSQVSALHKMTNKMVARGPDDEGFLLVNNSICTSYYGADTPINTSENKNIIGYPRENVENAYSCLSQVALGHRRLSIVDLTPHGHQPLCSTDQRYWIVFNGEIYNFQEIGKELEKLGVQFQGKSDTEILLNAYVKWGEACLDKLNGMFAFVIWDNQEKSLFCARDRIGIKPFYYTIQNQQFIFASDIKTIIASGLYKPEADTDGLYLAMAFGMAPRPKTAFKNVFALEQSHWMRIKFDGTIVKKRYWSLPIGSQECSMTEQNAIELLEEQLTTSIKYRLVADVPVGTFMSGGVDSTTVSAIAAKLHPGIKAFTLAYEDSEPEMDELPQAAATANMHPMEHIIKKVQYNDTISRLDQIVAGYEEPHYGLAANQLISGVVKDNNVKVVLNGLGGDELFAGYGWYNKIKMWKLLRLLSPIVGHLPNILGRRVKSYSNMSNIKSADRLHSLLYAQSTDKQLQDLFLNYNIADIGEYLHQFYVKDLTFSSDIESMSYMDLMSYIGNHHVHRIDQFTMSHSIEGRFPFLDHNLIEAAFRIPDQFKMHGNIQKYVLRKVAEKYIAPECLSMKKKGFGIPIQFFMRGELKNYVEDKIQHLIDRDTINPNTVNSLYQQYKNNQISAKRIWHLVMLEAWFEMFID
ncbi:MAG: asparagine synthase (glutamine-hydrolyzing) [Gammaproteobacteria bacterium]|nr:asparagine synthase (glutamine-hydrolyzing) [Gammaproteobacteria bacterium]